MRKILLNGVALSALLTALAAPLPAAAQVNGYVTINVGPPPMRIERIPAPRRGQVWVPGYWDWRGNRHAWVAGTWVRDRPGYAYTQPRWVQQDGRWAMERGGWARGGRGDRDRDGVPNRADRDRDGDGVPNRVDRNPNNPNRQ